MNSFIDRLTRRALRRGLRDGLLAGDGKWIAAGAVAWLVRFLMKQREPEVVVERLRVGEAILVTNIGPPLRGRKARKARRAARRASAEPAPDATA
ncbi:MAG: hypothetical protein ACLQK4_11810 [Acidimicrobiales bacterium]|jgi:hypothetical protein